jgi:hypothetical protein
MARARLDRAVEQPDAAAEGSRGADQFRIAKRAVINGDNCGQGDRSPFNLPILGSG